MPWLWLFTAAVAGLTHDSFRSARRPAKPGQNGASERLIRFYCVKLGRGQDGAVAVLADPPVGS